MKLCPLLIIALFLHGGLMAQFTEQITSDRPGLAFSAYTIGKNVIQLQTGLTHSQQITDLFNGETLNNTTNLRLGIAERFEVNSDLRFSSISGSFQEKPIQPMTHVDLDLGVRYNVLTNKGLIPALAIQASAVLPTLNQDDDNPVGLRLELATFNKLTNWLSVSTSFRNINRDNVYYGLDYALNFGYTITPKLGAFTEVYGKVNDGTVFFDCGASWLINSNIQFDVSTDWERDQENTAWFVDGGVSWRMDWRG